MTNPEVPFGEPQGMLVGEGVQGGWGEIPLVGESHGAESLPGRIDLGGGHFMVLHPAAFRTLLHSPAVVDELTARAKDICDHANNISALAPETLQRLSPNGDPPYDVIIQNEPDSTRARAIVGTANMAGIVSDAHGADLLKAVAAFPSDPVPSGIGPSSVAAQVHELET